MRSNESIVMVVQEKKKIIYIVYRILVQKKIGALIKKLIIPKSECIPIHKTREREGGSEGRNSQPKQVSSLQKQRKEKKTQVKIINWKNTLACEGGEGNFALLFQACDTKLKKGVILMEKESKNRTSK